MNWNFSGLAFIEFNLNQFKIFLSASFSPHECQVLSFAKLQKLDCSIIMNISLINRLKKSGSDIDP